MTLLGTRSSQVINISIEALPFICTHSLNQFCKREKNKCARKKREVVKARFYTTLVELYTEKVFWGFIPCDFLMENVCVRCVTVLVILSVILLGINLLRYHLSNVEKLNKTKALFT